MSLYSRARVTCARIRFDCVGAQVGDASRKVPFHIISRRPAAARLCAGLDRLCAGLDRLYAKRSDRSCACGIYLHGSASAGVAVFLFIATRRESLFNQYATSLDRLGLLRKRQLRVATMDARHYPVETQPHVCKAREKLSGPIQRSVGFRWRHAIRMGQARHSVA
jgi:hypothetical protein